MPYLRIVGQIVSPLPLRCCRASDIVTSVIMSTSDRTTAVFTGPALPTLSPDFIRNGLEDPAGAMSLICRSPARTLQDHGGSEVSNERVGRNDPCPCGSRKKYKKCCWDGAFTWVRDDQGEITKVVPISEEIRSGIADHVGHLHEFYERELRPDDLLFPPEDPDDSLDEMIAVMKKAGVDPAFIYAFQKTDRIVTEQNKQFLTDSEIREWDNAVREFHHKQGKIAPPR